MDFQGVSQKFSRKFFTNLQLSALHIPTKCVGFIGKSAKHSAHNMLSSETHSGQFGLSSLHVGSCKWSHSVQMSAPNLFLNFCDYMQLSNENYLLSHGRGPLLQEMKDNLEAVGAQSEEVPLQDWFSSRVS